VYAANQSGTGAAIARDGVYAASQSGAGAAHADTIMLQPYPVAMKPRLMPTLSPKLTG